jgi:transposase InsO family protein
MRTNGLRERWRRKFPHTSDSRHGFAVADNILARQFKPARPNQAWVSDIIYVRMRLALSGRAVLDLLERFLLNLKVERVWQRDDANHAEDKAHIADYILGFYNPVRLHSTLGYQSPSNYELRQALAAH